MAIPTETIWPAAAHTLAKHEILEKYLQRWMPIIANSFGRMMYIDGFCGPGIYEGGESGSPIVALRVANQLKTKASIKFVLCDGRQDRVDSLANQIKKEGCSSSIEIDLRTSTFEETVNDVLEEHSKSDQPPTFTLIDPFGFSGIPYKTIKELMHRRSSECLISFMVDSVNRWMEHPEKEIRKHVTTTFGTDKAAQIINGSGRDRISSLRNLYLEQLRKIAKYCRYFEMRNADNKVVYYLYFISNNNLGYIKMKEAMWAVDPSGSFQFSDFTDPNQPILFDSEDLWLPLVQKRIQAKYSGRSGVLVKEIKEFISEETIFLEKHMKHALRILEIQKDVLPHQLKSDGKKRRKNSFPDTVVVDFKSIS